jgi:hypothetical protein
MATLQDIRAKAQLQPRPLDWFQRQIRSLGNQFDTPGALMRSDIGQMTGRPDVGSMYMYLYDPKTKASLPYYDRFPLVFPYEDAQGGFYGLNLHYLPYGIRFQLLEALMKTKSTKTVTSDTELQLSWNILKSASRFPGVQPTVKRYLYSNIRSRILKVNPEDWYTAAMLPVEQFEGLTKQQVFNRSRKSL